MIKFALALTLSVGVTGSALAQSVSNELARAQMLGRELPIAVEARKMKPLAPFFADNVEQTINIADPSKPSVPLRIVGKSMVILGFEWNPVRVTPKVTGVMISRNAVSLIQATPKPSGDGLALAPIIHTFRLDTEGKIVRIETIVFDEFVDRGGS